MATAAVAEEETGVSSDELDSTLILICQPCKDDGNHLSAVGYCVNCREYLCQRCFDCHLVPTLTKKHLLLDKEHMTDVEQQENKYMCPEHRDEEIKYRCASHSFLGCHGCFFNHQKSCKDVEYIPEVSKNIFNSDELKEFDQKLSGLMDKCTEMSEYIKRQREVIKASHADAKIAIKQFKQEILALINNLEKKVSEDADKVKEVENSKLDEISKQCQNILMEVQRVSNRKERLQNRDHKCGLYITIQQSKESLLKMESTIQCLNYTRNKKFTFKSNTELTEMLRNPWGLGSLKTQGRIEKAEHTLDINVKNSNDKKSSCYCTASILLSSNRLIVLDNVNCSMKLVDTKRNKLVSNLKLSSNPWGVCSIDETVVAVSLYNEKTIAMVRIGLALSVERNISVNGSPRGIGYQDGKLLVSYGNPAKVELMDIQGNVIRTFVTDSNGKALFSNPYHLAINPDNKLIYISNFSYNNVVCMELDGTVVATYEDHEMLNPLQATFDSNGNVYVCGYGSNNVHQITEDCKKVKVVLTSADGLKYPSSISYQENEEKIYIGQNGDNNVKVFKVTMSNV